MNLVPNEFLIHNQKLLAIIILRIITAQTLSFNILAMASNDIDKLEFANWISIYLNLLYFWFVETYWFGNNNNNENKIVIQ